MNQNLSEVELEIIFHKVITFLFFPSFCFLLVVQGFELKAFCLLGRSLTI
jgi:hypothetical protein